VIRRSGSELAPSRGAAGLAARPCRRTGLGGGGVPPCLRRVGAVFDRARRARGSDLDTADGRHAALEPRAWQERPDRRNRRRPGRAGRGNRDAADGGAGRPGARPAAPGRPPGAAGPHAGRAQQHAAVEPARPLARAHVAGRRVVLEEVDDQDRAAPGARRADDARPDRPRRAASAARTDRHDRPRSGTRPGSRRPLPAARIPLAVGERRAGRLRVADARALRRRCATARARRGNPAPRPAPAVPNRNRDRPPRDRSREALDRNRIRPASLANRPRYGAPSPNSASSSRGGGNSHRRRGHATPAVPSRRRGGRRRPPQLDAARSARRGAPLGAGRSPRGGAGRADRRFIRPGRRGLRLAAATPRRGTPLS
jgi:hypothetical protein